MTPRSLVAASAFALTLALTGCGDDDVAPDPSPSTSRATASPSASATPAPALPEAATKEDILGAQTFTRHWFATVTHAMQTGDTDAMKVLAAPECTACTELIATIDEIYANNTRITGGGWQIKEMALDPKAKMPYRRWLMDMVQPKQDLVDATGNVVDPDERLPFSLWFTITWRDGHWLAYESRNA